MGRSLNPMQMIGRLTAEPSDLSREAGLFCQIRRLLNGLSCCWYPPQARIVREGKDGYWQ